MPEPLGVLHLIKGLGPGGAEQLLVQQARCRDQTRFDYQVAYLVPEKDHLVAALEAADVAVQCLDGPDWPIALRNLAGLPSIDVVHAHSPVMASAVRVAARTLPAARRPRLVTTEHNRWPRHHRLTRAANRLTLRWDDATLAVSDDVAATMPGRATVESLVHGIDVAAVRSQLDHRSPMRRELGFAEHEIVVANVANLRREKAHDVLLRAAASAIAVDERLRFVIVGQGPLAAEIHRLHHELGLGDRVRLLGYRADATRVVAASDVFTLSSRHEGLPVALMEALALARPVVATTAGGIPQAVTHDREALLVDVDDHRSLAEAYLALAGDAPRRARLGAAADRRAEAFDVRRTIGRLESVYAAVVNGEPTSSR